MLHSNNFNTYSPTLTGTGASGTWGISITGNSATVTNGVYTTGDQTIGGSKTFTGIISVTASEGREITTFMPSSYTTNDLVSGHEYGWYDDHWRLGMTRSSASAGADFVIQWNGARRLSLTNAGNLTVTGTIGATNLSGTNTGDETTARINALAITTVGTITGGTWNGSSISTTYTDAKVTSVTGTTNQVSVSANTGAITLSLPQNIHTGASPTFADATLTGGLTIGGSLSRGTYTIGSNYVTGADNIVLKGNASGVSGIFFESEKDGTNINHPSDFGFIQFHPYGIGGSSGEANELVIGVSNDADDMIVFNPVDSNGIKVRVGAGTTEYTVYHAGNIPTWNQNTSGNAATVTNGVYTTGDQTIGGIKTFSSRIVVGTFANSTTNTGEAWFGRASDRNAGTFTVQLGGNSASSRQFEVVDYAWSTVLFAVNSNGTATISGSAVKTVANSSYSTSFSSVSSVTVTHNLGTKDVMVMCYDNNDEMFWPSSIVTTSTSVVTITFAASRTGRVVVLR
jgi:hypothetical protein